jgi:hypothetical protein
MAKISKKSLETLLFLTEDIKVIEQALKENQTIFDETKSNQSKLMIRVYSEILEELKTNLANLK